MNLETQSRELARKFSIERWINKLFIILYLFKVTLKLIYCIFVVNSYKMRNLLKQNVVYTNLAIFYLIVSFLTRLVLLFHPITQSTFSFLEIIRIYFLQRYSYLRNKINLKKKNYFSNSFTKDASLNIKKFIRILKKNGWFDYSNL